LSSIKELEKLAEESEGEGASECSLSDDGVEADQFTFKFDANALLNPLLCANISRKSVFASDALDDSEFDNVLSFVIILTARLH